MIPLTATVGIGGSITLRTLGIDNALAERGNKVANHWQPNLTRTMRNTIRRKQLNSDIFLSSSNAVTMDGGLVNIDGSGNRVASMIFGPKKVIVVVGVNKLVRNVEAGIMRARNIASSMNARRLNCKTPCSKTGMCDDDRCNLPERICRIITILEKKPSDTDFTVLLVGEELGY
jgi:L-lactate utilization protein LutB